MDTEMKVDPVCGMKVDPGKGGPQAEFQGTLYYFCSDGCKSKFVKSPASYLGKEKRT